MRDEIHEEPRDFIRNPQDHNSYSWGRINGHDVVFTSLPAGGYGKVNAASCVTELLSSLPEIKFGLMVGIGAGLPNAQHDIRLGDVVVSQPNGTHGGVIQYDLGKAKSGLDWEPVGSLNAPPRVVLNALASLQADHECGKLQFVGYLREAINKNADWGARYSHPPDELDRLFESKDVMDHDGITNHTEDREVLRPPRSSKDPQVHYGTIASGDTLVKDSVTRDAIPAKVKHTCLCLEMQAAGIMDKFHCLVVRGICDYADSHKNDHWQHYASATAAAFAKELLCHAPIDVVRHSKNAADSMELQATLNPPGDRLARADHRLNKAKVDSFLKDLYSCPYTERKDTNTHALEGTCQWFIKHEITNFMHNPGGRLLWVSADPGCGKSVLAKYLVDEVLNIEQDRIICYFFFKDGFSDQNRCVQAIHAVLRQLIVADCSSLTENTLDQYTQGGSTFLASFGDLWKAFMETVNNSVSKSIICVFDALDECQPEDRRVLIKAMDKWYRRNTTPNLKILATSRPYYDIRDDFHDLTTSYPNIRLSGEDKIESDEISREIDIVLKDRIHKLSVKRDLLPPAEKVLVEKFISNRQRTYLWAHLAMYLLETAPSLTPGRIKELVADLPSGVEQAYEKMLNQSPDFVRTRLILNALLAAQRPLLVGEMSLILSLNGQKTQSHELEDDVEPIETFQNSVKDFCGLFVTVVDDRVYFIHQTAREFLTKAAASQTHVLQSQESLTQTWGKNLHVSESHRVLTERCIRYLLLADADTYHESFYEYCSTYWIVHFRKGQIARNSSLNNLAVTVFKHWSVAYHTLPYRVVREHGLGQFIHHTKQRPIPAIMFPSWFGFPNVIEALLDQDPLIKNREDVMYSALYLACHAGKVDTARTLLASGAMTHGRHNNVLKFLEDERPLTMAMNCPDLELFRVLLDHASIATAVDNADANGYTPLHHVVLLETGTYLNAIYSPRYPKVIPAETLEIIQGLLGKGANPELRAHTGGLPIHLFLFHYACIWKSLTGKELVAMLKLLIADNDINEHDPEAGANLMCFAAMSGHASIIRAMVEIGGSIHSIDQAGNSLLHWAALSSVDSGAIEYLVSNGVDVESRNHVGSTALWSASVLSRSCESCKALIKAGASIDAPDKDGRTPFIWLAIRETLNHVSELPSPLDGTWILEDVFALHALHEGECSSSEITGLLIDSGANINSQDLNGNTCIHYAARGSYRILKELFEAGPDVNIKNLQGQTALHAATKSGSPSPHTIVWLLTHSADSKALDEDGRAAIWYIEQRLQRVFWLEDPVHRQDELLKCLVLLRYGLDAADLNSLRGDHEFELYLDNTIRKPFMWMRDID